MNMTRDNPKNTEDDFVRDLNEIRPETVAHQLAAGVKPGEKK